MSHPAKGVVLYKICYFFIDYQKEFSQKIIFYFQTSAKYFSIDNSQFMFIVCS